MIFTTRRTFVRMLLGLGLGGGATAAGACERAARDVGSATGRDAGERDAGTTAGRDAGELGGGGAAPRDPAGDAEGAPTFVARPVLRPWAEDIVWIGAPVRALPVAYVSMAHRRVFVDRAHRDRAAWLLDAHISVSTALWRIPLPGDPPGEPITPGDAEREFEERPMRDWDPGMIPAMDDVRIRLGSPTAVRVDFACAPLVGRLGDPSMTDGAEAGEQWLEGGPWTLRTADGEPQVPVREDFMVVGEGFRHADRRCSGPGEEVRYVGWAIRP